MMWTRLVLLLGGDMMGFKLCVFSEAVVEGGGGQVECSVGVLVLWRFDGE
jgi:hypothetical protein